MRRNVRESAQLLQGEVQAEIQAQTGVRRRQSWAIFLTFTYAADVAWEPGHITGCAKCVRDWCSRVGLVFRYVWVLELTQAGRPHYHAVVWLPYGVKLPMPDRRGWWPHGSTKTELARSPVGYICKYASKGIGEGQSLPKGARLSGSGGLSRAARQERSWRLCPAWVREVFTVEDRPVRAPGGGWLSRLTGAFEAARWKLVARAPDWSWLRFAPVGEVLPCPA